MAYRLILASASPRRLDLLALAGLNFEALSVDIDERVEPHETPEAYTRRVSRQKAEAAQYRVDGHALIIAADTSVVDGDTILGKPLDAEDAALMLRRLRGKMHHVYTAITILDTQTQRLQQELVSSPVTMRPYTENEMAAYIASGDPMDKAGSYAIQNPQFKPVAQISGCYANVVGLPLCHLTRLLKQFGVAIEVDIASACQRHQQIECMVYPDVLAGRL